MDVTPGRPKFKRVERHRYQDEERGKCQVKIIRTYNGKPMPGQRSISFSVADVTVSELAETIEQALFGQGEV